MAMNLATAQTEIEDILKAAAVAEWGNTEADYAGFATVVAAAVVQALQHILDNAEDSLGGAIT